MSGHLLKDIKVDPTNPLISFLLQSGRSITPYYSFDLTALVCRLEKLVDWYNFGVLLKVPSHVLRKIEADHPDNLDRRKTELYEYWLNNEHNPSWYKVCDALMNMPKERDALEDVINNVFPLMSYSEKNEFSHPFPPPPPKLTIAHQSNIACSLTEIQIKFADLVSDIQETLEKLPFEKIKRFISGFLHTTLKFDQKPQDLDELFDQLKPHYCFMNYGVLEVVVQRFVKETMEVHIKGYTSQLEEWLQSTTVVEFKVAVENQLEQVTQLGDPLCPVVPVVLKLQGPWMEVTVSNLQKLLKYIFRDKSSVLTHIRIERGSVIVRLLAPQSELLPLLSLASKTFDDMIYLGIDSVQISTLILKPFLLYQLAFHFNDGFHGAVSMQNASLVQFFIELGINPNTRDKYGATPLVNASMYGNIDSVIILLEHNADISIKTNDKNSALHAAARFGFPKIAQILLKVGLSPNDQDVTGATPLIFAILGGHTAIVELFIKNKANVNHTDKHGQSALFPACEKNYLKIVQLLLQAGASPNLQRYHDGISALHIACANRFLELAQTLLQFKANPNIQNTNGVTPLMMATHLSYHDIVDLLVKSGARVDLKVYNAEITALMFALYCNNPAIITTLLKAKANVNIQDYQGWTALFMASFIGDKEIIKQLLLYKADPNLCAKDGRSPLHVASNKDVAEFLLKAGASPNPVGGTNAETPLYRACATGSVDIVQVLLQNNANPNVLTTLGITPLCVAAIIGHIEIADILLKAGAEVDLHRIDNDWTPLFFAAVGGHFKIVELLLKYEASLKENKHGVTPQVAAFCNGQYNIAYYLFGVAASTSQLSLPTLVPEPTFIDDIDEEYTTEDINIEPISVATDQSSIEAQTTSSDEPISQARLVNEEENTSNRPPTQPSEESDEKILSFFNKVRSTISSSVKWIQKSYDNMIKRFENYLETSKQLQIQA